MELMSLCINVGCVVVLVLWENMHTREGVAITYLENNFSSSYTNITCFTKQLAGVSTNSYRYKIRCHISTCRRHGFLRDIAVPDFSLGYGARMTWMSTVVSRSHNIQLFLVDIRNLSMDFSKIKRRANMFTTTELARTLVLYSCSC